MKRPDICAVAPWKYQLDAVNQFAPAEEVREMVPTKYCPGVRLRFNGTLAMRCCPFNDAIELLLVFVH